MEKPVVDPDQFDFRKISDQDTCQIDCTDKDGKDGQGLQKFLNKYALKHQNSNLGVTYIVYYKKYPIGYITLAASQIDKDEILRDKRPSTRATRHFPAIIIAYFAIEKKLQKCGYGSHVLKWCNGRAREIAARIGCRYIVLYTKDAMEFYKKNHYQIAELDNKEEFVMMYFDLFPERKQAMG